MSLWTEKKVYGGDHFLSISIQKKNISFQIVIVGGELAEANEFPWTALLSLNNSGNGATARCGGSLISDRFVAEIQHHHDNLPSLQTRGDSCPLPPAVYTQWRHRISVR